MTPVYLRDLRSELEAPFRNIVSVRHDNRSIPFVPAGSDRKLTVEAVT